ncbi:MurR/RpiR family transcriptional regulator [Actinomadura algeriensis]|uniref:DNA-binding MurR/RpiR family transcriptional regulator n=1 Tax=Actinomadura algeriensis TaxID=1679523 RepID=A0ABR9JLE0_9ACTN|nr:MurR/RpiR family transcriptional regulator [Actinomadura algeriensis]MBE1531379.1 DNA-binding MurR/RpiR family transcriptional regulator [Actinomadura algeriensis]
MRKPIGPEPGGTGAAPGAPGDEAPGKDPTPLSTVVRVRSLLPSLPPAERRVAQRVIDDPEGVANSTITELAQNCGTSETTVIRFCRAIGFHGYPELRLTLATEAGRAQTAAGGRVIGSDISPDDSLEQIVEKVTFADARAVEETASQLDIKMLEQVVDAVVAAERVDVYGVGASAFVAADFQQKLHRIGRVCSAWADAHIMLTSAAVLGSGDVAIGISHTGATVETIDALEVAKSNGVTTVALTNFPRSPIAEVADLILTTAARETTFRSGATASRLAQLTVVDCLFVGVAQRTYGPTRKALEATYEAVRGRTVRPDRRRR